MGHLSLFLVILVFSLNSKALIYGTDDRAEVYTSPRAERLAQSTATMVGQAYILPQTQGTFNLDFYLASDQYALNLCKEEKFSDQPWGWLNCSGFLVGEDILVTAGHCMIFSHGGKEGIIEDNVPTSTMCENFNWVFDFSQKNSTQPVSITNISPDNIYSCKKVIYAEFMSTEAGSPKTPQGLPVTGEYGRDFAIIQLDRKVVGRKPLVLSQSLPQATEPLTVIGYPSALPAKYATGEALPSSYINYFLSDLDIMNGNSGSAVFNSQDEVVGIVVRGHPYEDYQYVEDRGCYKNIICTKIGDGDCKPSDPSEVLGTHVQKSEMILEKLKEILNN